MNALRNFGRALAIALLIAAHGQAATKEWIGNAPDVVEIKTITVGGTWAASSGETAILTINGKPLAVSVLADATTDNVATALKEAWASLARLDGTGSTDATSNFGGSAFGEFSEVTATVSGSVVTLTAKTAGKPFTVTESETSTSGTLAQATVQAASGQHFWNNATNWDTGTVPANDDLVVIKGGPSILYGLPQDADNLEVTLNIYKSFENRLGLPSTNRDNASQPYPEYRDQWVELDDSGTGTNLKHRFGMGSAGSGSPLIKVRQLALKASPIVYATGTPLTGVANYALYLQCAATTSTLDIHSGFVDFSSQSGGTSAFADVKQVGGTSRGFAALDSSASVTLSGGSMLVGGSGGFSSLMVYGGTGTLEDQSGTISVVLAQGGQVVDKSTGTISTLSVLPGGTFDASGSPGFTVTSGSVIEGGRFLDPFRRMTIGTDFSVSFDPSNDLQFGASILAPIEISN